MSESVTRAAGGHRRNALSRLSAGHVVMIVAGLLAALVNFNLLQQREATFDVAVARTDVIPGGTVSADDFISSEIRATSDVLETLVMFEERASLEGMVAVRSLSSGELVSASDFQDAAADFQQRAMSIPVDPEDAVGGRIAEADTVDIIHVENGIARYVAVSVSVLAVAEGEDGFAATSSFYITVAVDADLALRISSALDSGTVRLVRSTGANPPEVLLFDPVLERMNEGEAAPEASEGDAETDRSIEEDPEAGS